MGGELWRVNIRRPGGSPKYIGPAGWSNALYRADLLLSGLPAVLLEGEIDALTVAQRVGDLVSAVATGSTTGGRRSPWLTRLAAAPLVLVAFDADQAGEEASAYWLSALSNARRLRPVLGKDANALAQAGGDVRAWVLEGLARFGQEL